MPAHSQYGQRDSQPLEEVHAQWQGGVNTVLPADRLPGLQFTHALNMELRKGYPETRRSVERANWLYRKGAKLGTVFQGAGLVQGTTADAVTRAPTALLVVCDNNLWLCAPNNEPLLLLAGVTADTQPVEILDAHGEHLILRGVSQPPLRYRYKAGQRPRALPAPRAIGAFAQLPASDTGCHAGNRVWLKKGKSRVVASDIYEWDYDAALQDFAVGEGENDEIVRLWPYGEDRIVVFKTRSVHVIDGVSAMDTTADPPVLPTIYRVAAARGCVAPYTVAQRGSAVLYLSREGVETLELSASAVTTQAAVPLSKAMDRYFQEVRWQGISGARAIIADSYYLLSVPTRFGSARFYPYPMVTAPWDVSGDPPGDWYPITGGDAKLASCSPSDPADADLPAWAALGAEEALPQMDHYGVLGMEAARVQTGRTGEEWWRLCAHLAWCDGPEAEAVPLSAEWERYTIRWRAKLEAGRVYYGRADGAWQEASAALFPDAPLTGAVGLSFCFDANARPCFAVQIGARVELRRFVAGVPTIYAWAGTWPQLFFNGVVERDSNLRDVVCHYLRSRVLRARIQRDNFSTEYWIANPEQPDGTNQLSRLCSSGRGAGELASHQLIAAETIGGTRLLLRSGVYQPWPERLLEAGAAAVAVESIAYAHVVQPVATVAESATAATAVESISYAAVSISLPAVAEAAATAAAVEAIAYPATSKAVGSYTEGAGATAAIDSIAYVATSVAAGTYAEPATQTSTIESISYV